MRMVDQGCGAEGPRQERAPDSTLNLSQLVDSLALESMMLDFYHLTSIPMSLVALDGEIIVGAGWQEVCMRFHRAHPQTCAFCLESDIELSAGIPAGDSRLYRCKNGMWDAAMPVFVGDQHVANVLTGQFFFDDEQIDVEFFRGQAETYGFPEQEYLDLIQSVPRLSRDTVETGLKFLTKLAVMLSRLTLANSQLASVVQQRENLLDREREQTARLQTLAEIESVLTSSLDFTEVIERALEAAETSLRVVASSVWTLGFPNEKLTLVGWRGFPALFAADFADGVSLREPYPVAQAASGRTPILFECVANAALHAPVLDAYARYGIEVGALAAVPLIVRDRVIGALTLAWSEQRRFGPDDRMLIDTLASRFSVALENAQTYLSEHMIAETLQETLVVLPTHVHGVSFSRAYESATFESGRVGGDFVDIFPVRDHIVGITLGDVSGKGLDAAVTTSTIRTTLRVHALDGLTVAEIAAKANQVMRRFSEIESFVTLWFGLLDTRTGLLRYVCAGHPPAFVMSAEGATRELPCLDPILGAFDEAKFLESQTLLVRGDRMIVYSDGATEARTPAGDFLDTEGLIALCERHRAAPTPELSQLIMHDVVAFSEGMLRDDAAILAVELVELGDVPDTRGDNGDTRLDR